jgi:prevent-host-death family protein
MRSVGICEAKSRLSELIAAAEAGETIVLTRNGRAVVELRPAVRATGQAVERIRALRGLRVGTSDLRGLIEEGRR